MVYNYSVKKKRQRGEMLFNLASYLSNSLRLRNTTELPITSQTYMYGCMRCICVSLCASTCKMYGEFKLKQQQLKAQALNVTLQDVL